MRNPLSTTCQRFSLALVVVFKNTSLTALWLSEELDDVSDDIGGEPHLEPELVVGPDIHLYFYPACTLCGIHG